MNTSTKTDQKASVNASQKVSEKPIAATQPAVKKPTVEAKKSELPGKPPVATSKEPVVSERTSPTPVQTQPVDIKPDTTKIEQPKNPTKADKAKAIYDEMIKDPKNDRQAIIARLKKEVGLTKAGAQTYYYKFQRDSGRVVEKQPSKMDKAKEVFEKMTFDGQSRKEIIVAFVKEVGLTKAGASTYFQTLKKSTVKPAKVEKAS